MRAPLALLLGLALTVSAAAQGNQFKVRYRGGTVQADVKPDEWGNVLTISPTRILLVLKGGQQIEIDPRRVTKIAYSKDDARDGKRAAVSITAYLLSKKRRHYIGIEYVSPAGDSNFVNLQAKGDKYRTILTSLKTVTVKDVTTEGKDENR